MPRLTCPHCSKPLEALEEDRGQRIECPNCGGALRVPAAAPPASRPARIDPRYTPPDYERPREKTSNAAGWIIGILAVVVFCVVGCCGFGYWFFTKRVGPALQDMAKEIQKEV